MKEGQCQLCNTPIEVSDDYKPEYCCDGYMCGCYGLALNPLLCDKCEEKAFGREVGGSGE